MSPVRHLLTASCCVVLAACSSSPSTDNQADSRTRGAQTRKPSLSSERLSLADTQQANEIVLVALGLLDTGYRFGGKNPDAGLDCSGMVSYVVEHATGLALPHNAAQIAKRTRPIDRNELRPADLVFFNTSGQTFSHMGIYLGDGKFVHAPSTGGKVRVDKMDMPYYASRFVAARSLF
ncbi:C40 family peptidase [Uliginosibacterium gangwonense]|uniref:C40 family peptidase n=1 Tax=Uliginosibacterium gangwonense TaxID=392736 RepID=UPI00037BB94C|nr:C40 family peptidase [Uliginosibacterium gangwonense]